MVGRRSGSNSHVWVVAIIGQGAKCHLVLSNDDNGGLFWRSSLSLGSRLCLATENESGEYKRACKASYLFLHHSLFSSSLLLEEISAQALLRGTSSWRSKSPGADDRAAPCSS